MDTSISSAFFLLFGHKKSYRVGKSDFYLSYVHQSAVLLNKILEKFDLNILKDTERYRNMGFWENDFNDLLISSEVVDRARLLLSCII